MESSENESGHICKLKESTLGASAQDLFEGLSEVLVKDSVNNWVKTRIAVPDPEEKSKERVRDGTCVWAHCLQRIGEEEGKPTDYKDTNHHSQNKGEALLPVDQRFTSRRSRGAFWL